MNQIGNMATAEIKALVMSDFDVVITSEQASAIGNADRNGCLLWSDSRLTTTNSSQINRGKAQAAIISSFGIIGW